MEDEALEAIKKRKMNELMGKIREIEKISHFPSLPVIVTDSNFESFINSHRLVAVDFWAAWCSPCRMLAPIIESLAKTYVGKVMFAKLNIDENPQSSLIYGITSIPVLAIFKNTVEVDRIVGLVSKNIIETKIQKYL